MTPPDDRERREEAKRRFSGFGLANRKVAEITAATINLAVAVGLFAGLGYWGDQKLGHRVPWLFLIGFAVGLTGGFIGFFRTVLGKNK